MTNPIVSTYHNIIMLYCNDPHNRTNREYNDESRRICHLIRSQTHNYANSNVEKVNYEWDHPRDNVTAWHIDRENFCSARMLIAWMRSHFRGSTATRRANTRDLDAWTNAYRLREMRNWLPIPSELALLLLTSSVAFRE